MLAITGLVGRNAFHAGRGPRLAVTNRAITSVAEQQSAAMLVVLTKERLAATITVDCFRSESPWAGITDDDRKVGRARIGRIKLEIVVLKKRRLVILKMVHGRLSATSAPSLGTVGLVTFQSFNREPQACARA